MVQGAVKVKKSARASQGNPSRTKKGSRTIAPRKALLIKNAKITKKHTSALTSMTEYALGAKAGHLELLKGGKNTKDTTTGSTGSRKGGTKKFG